MKSFHFLEALKTKIDDQDHILLNNLPVVGNTYLVLKAVKCFSSENLCLLIDNLLHSYLFQYYINGTVFSVLFHIDIY